jgi:hypothetical protein
MNTEINRTPGIIAALSYLNLTPPPIPFIQLTPRAYHHSFPQNHLPIPNPNHHSSLSIFPFKLNR